MQRCKVIYFTFYLFLIYFLCHSYVALVYSSVFAVVAVGCDFTIAVNMLCACVVSSCRIC